MAEHLKSVFRFATRLPLHAALALIAVYQHTLSPVLPVLFGPGCGCRFTPTCSHYAAGALRTHGFFAGLFLAARRLVKCTPLHPGGHDPIPPSPLDWLRVLSRFDKLEAPSMPRGLSKRLKLRRTNSPGRPACRRVERFVPMRSARLGAKPRLLRSLMRTTEDTVHLGSSR